MDANFVPLRASFGAVRLHDNFVSPVAAWRLHSPQVDFRFYCHLKQGFGYLLVRREIGKPSTLRDARFDVLNCLGVHAHQTVKRIVGFLTLLFYLWVLRRNTAAFCRASRPVSVDAALHHGIESLILSSRRLAFCCCFLIEALVSLFDRFAPSFPHCGVFHDR